MRAATIDRQTRETQVHLTLNIDGSGEGEISTGVGFFDHMLRHIAMHALFDLTVQAKGDIEVDPHHTVEDVALALGAGLDRALGDRKGLVRMSFACVPMDESLVQVAIDLSGRPYTVVDAAFSNLSIGQLPVTLITHFFESLATAARMNLHARVLYGRDDHHKAEGLFKALGRALEMAVRLEPRRAGMIPSTKGTL